MPRAGLSPEVVVAEAARICDDSGFDRLTLAAVAQRFGVAVPSLYKHIAGLDALRREVALRGIRDLGGTLAAAVADGGGLTEIAHAYRGYARAHPGRYAATLRAPDPEDAEAGAATQPVLDTVLGVMGGYGLKGPDAIDATRALRAALHGFVELEMVGGFGLPQDVDRSFERLVEFLDTAFSNWAP